MLMFCTMQVLAISAFYGTMATNPYTSEIEKSADLALLYGCTTKAFNWQTKNNIAKSDGYFRLQLTKDEYNEKHYTAYPEFR